MTSEAQPVQRLRAYLAALPPQTQASLLARLERAALRDEHARAVSLILEGLRPAIAASARRPARAANPARLFFAPAEPFLVRNNVPWLPAGLLARAALTPLWNWIERDLVPQHAKIYSEQAAEALLAGDLVRAAGLARNFQDYAAQAMSNLLERLDTDEKDRRRAAGQVGTLRGLLDVRDLLTILRHRDKLAAFAQQLPDRIPNLMGAQAEQILVRLLTTSHANPEVLPFALVLLKGRLQDPTQLIRLAVMAAGSDAAARISQAPLAPAVALILGDLRLHTDDLRAAFKENRIFDAVQALKLLRDGVRGMQAHMDVSRDSAWSRELGAIRGEVAELVSRQIASVPSAVRRLLRLPQPQEVAGRPGLDESDVADTEARLALVVAARSFADELAMNQTSRTVHLELQHYIDAHMPVLIDALRAAPAPERAFRRAQAEAGMRFAAKIFGSEYAAQVARAVTIAGERRAPRG